MRGIRIRATIILFPLALLTFTLPPASPANPAALDDPLARPEVLLANIQAAASVLDTSPVKTVEQNGQVYQVLNLEFTDPDKCSAFVTKPVQGSYVLNRYQRFADVMIPQGKQDVLLGLTKLDGLVWLDAIHNATIPPPPPLAKAPGAARSTPDAIVRGGISGLTGKGVLVAVIDTGVDFRHADFCTFDSKGVPSSRIVYFWDTFRPYDRKVGLPAPMKYPDGTPIGTILTRDDLNRDLRSKDHPLGVTDQGGHGTACAGVAAGGGKGANKYVGVAPDAELIVVRIAREKQTENDYLITGICQWLDQIAGQRPLVISCSWGQKRGGHDGSLIWERQLRQRWPGDRAGRILCFAAGNDGTANLHGEVTFAGDDSPGLLSWDGQGESQIEIYIDAVTAAQVTIKAADQTKLSGQTTWVNPLSHALVLRVNAPAGKGGLYLTTSLNKKLRADAYIAPFDATKPGQFTGACARNEDQIETPGSAPVAITVGSYDFNDLFDMKGTTYWLYANPDKKASMTIGSLSYYSNAGYLRGSTGGIVKPEIVAPGQYHVAPASAGAKDLILDTTGKYRYFNGTSAATPYTAGIAALLFQKKQGLTADGLRLLFKTNATQDTYTGKCPNESWGYGKLDLAAVKRIVQNVR